MIILNLPIFLFGSLVVWKINYELLTTNKKILSKKISADVDRNSEKKIYLLTNLIHQRRNCLNPLSANSTKWSNTLKLG